MRFEDVLGTAQHSTVRLGVKEMSTSIDRTIKLSDYVRIH